MLLVLDLSIGQRGTVVDAPVNRLQPAIHESLLKKSVQRLQRPRLVLAGHRLVGLVPAAKAANALKLRGLQVDVLLRVGAAGFQHRRSRHFQLLAAKLLIHLDLDGQTVAVVTGNIRRIISGHGLRFNDEVLEALVQRVAQVNGAMA